MINSVFAPFGRQIVYLFRVLLEIVEFEIVVGGQGFEAGGSIEDERAK